MTLTDPRSWSRPFGRAVATVAIIVITVANAEAKPPTDRSGTSSCKGKKPACSPTQPDTVPPTITILEPTPGSEVSAELLVTGQAADDDGVAAVDVKLGDGAFIRAAGTSDWSITLDLTGAADGETSITARATDRSGNTAVALVKITIRAAAAEPSPAPSPTNAPPESDDLVLTSTLVPGSGTWESLVPLGRGRLAERGGIVAMLMHTEFSHRPSLFFRDTAAGGTSTLALPTDTTNDWWEASSTWTSGGEFWVLSGPGPITIRRYALTGSPLPTAATLLDVRRFGNTDSRPGDIISLPSGAVVASWHQQGETTSQGHSIAYRSPSTGSWSITSFTNAPTKASKEVLVRQPSDGSVWLFSNADAWSSIAAVRFLESGQGLSISWKDPSFISAADGAYDADPENPDLAVSVDTSRGHIVLAYQSAERARFSSTVIGSYPAIARIDAGGGKTFTHYPVFVERVSALGVVVSGDDVWLSLRPVDPASLSFDELHVARLRDEVWTTTTLGKLYHPYERVGYGLSHPTFAVRTADDRIRLFSG